MELKETYMEETSRIIKLNNEWTRKVQDITVKGEDAKEMFIDRKWTNDNIVEAAMNLANDRAKGNGYAHIMNSFIIHTMKDKGYNGVKSWCKQSIFGLEKVLFPIMTRNQHWILIYANNYNRTIQVLDPYHDERKEFAKLVQTFLRLEYHKQYPEDTNTPYEIINTKDHPLQTDRNSCGRFIISYAEAIINETEFQITQENVNDYRNYIVFNLFHNAPKA